MIILHSGFILFIQLKSSQEGLAKTSESEDLLRQGARVVWIMDDIPCKGNSATPKEEMRLIRMGPTETSQKKGNRTSNVEEGIAMERGKI